MGHFLPDRPSAAGTECDSHPSYRTETSLSMYCAAYCPGGLSMGMGTRETVPSPGAQGAAEIWCCNSSRAGWIPMAWRAPRPPRCSSLWKAGPLHPLSLWVFPIPASRLLSGRNLHNCVKAREKKARIYKLQMGMFASPGGLPYASAHILLELQCARCTSVPLSSLQRAFDRNHTVTDRREARVASWSCWCSVSEEVLAFQAAHFQRVRDDEQMAQDMPHYPVHSPGADRRMVDQGLESLRRQDTISPFLHSPPCQFSQDPTYFWNG